MTPFIRIMNPDTGGNGPDPPEPGIYGDPGSRRSDDGELRIHSPGPTVCDKREVPRGTGLGGGINSHLKSIHIQMSRSGTVNMNHIQSVKAIKMASAMADTSLFITGKLFNYT